MLQDAVGAGEVPSAQRELGLVLFLYRSFAVPGDALPWVDGAGDETILVRAAETVLGEFISKVRGCGETVERVARVRGNRRETGLVQEGLNVRCKHQSNTRA